MPKLGKMEYALAMETLKFSAIMRDIMSQLGISAKSLDVKSGLLQVMMYELLFGSGKIIGGGAVKRKIMENKDKLFQIRDTMMEGKASHSELLSGSVQVASQLPLYVRINLAKLSISDGLKYLQDRYYSDAILDDLIPSLVILPSNCRGLSQDPFIKDGSMIIQDKASCFPTQILFNEYQRSVEERCVDAEECDFIDACAAPGNKTSHLAALLMDKSPNPNQHAIFAFEKSVNRVKIIQNRMALLAVDDVVIINHKDFLTVDVSEDKYSKVQYLLLDPSCSGSGIVRNIERIVEANRTHDEEDEKIEDEGERLLKLQSFQISVILKAMTFPHAHTISYSTCSVHEQENEQVVAHVLATEIGKDWEISSPVGFSSWSHRGNACTYLASTVCEKLIRCAPEDGTNGFFICLFKKKCNAIRDLSKHSINETSRACKKPRLMKQSNASAPALDASIVTEHQTIPASTATQPQQNKGLISSPNHAMPLFTSRFHVSKTKKRKFGRK